MSYKIMFKNENSSSDKNILESGLNMLEIVKADFNRFMNADYDSEDYEEFYSYALCYDFSEATEDTAPYFRYQIAWGGPSYEVRFFESGHIQFVYLDWFCGIGFDVTETTEFQWLKEYFEGAEQMDFIKEVNEIVSQFDENDFTSVEQMKKIIGFYTDIDNSLDYVQDRLELYLLEN
jgi:hypothetical protein